MNRVREFTARSLGARGESSACGHFDAALKADVAEAGAATTKCTIASAALQERHGVHRVFPVAGSSDSAAELVLFVFDGRSGREMRG